jgi:hypothetical protein
VPNFQRKKKPMHKILKSHVLSLVSFLACINCVNAGKIKIDNTNIPEKINEHEVQLTLNFHGAQGNKDITKLPLGFSEIDLKDDETYNMRLEFLIGGEKGASYGCENFTVQGDKMYSRYGNSTKVSSVIRLSYHETSKWYPNGVVMCDLYGR